MSYGDIYLFGVVVTAIITLLRWENSNHPWHAEQDDYLFILLISAFWVGSLPWLIWITFKEKK